MAGLDPIYTSIESVVIRLAGKVSTDTSNPRAVPKELLNQLIVDAETAVEQDLRGRYAVPFQSIKGQTFQALPDHSKRAIRTIVDTMSVIMILRYSFGSGTHITGDGFTKLMQDQYDGLLRRLLGQDMEGNEFGQRRFRRTPPLDDLKLAPTNIADDGYRGMVADARPRSPNSADNYAAHQTNDPSLGIFWYYGLRGSR
jgi:hypothetical protein